MAQFDSIRFQPSRPLLKEVTADRLNGILAEIKKNRPKGERGITVRQTGDGAFIGLAATLRGGGVTPMPWDIYVEDFGGENQYKLKVRPGTLSGILPLNWDDEFEASGDDLYYGIAKVKTDGQYINGLTIEIGKKQPKFQEAVKFGLASEIDILFGLFKDGASYNVTGGTNIDVSGKNVLSLFNSADIGFPAYDLYFRLQ